VTDIVSPKVRSETEPESANTKRTDAFMYGPTPVGGWFAVEVIYDGA
jgi:hypothetical protein